MWHLFYFLLYTELLTSDSTLIGCLQSQVLKNLLFCIGRSTHYSPSIHFTGLHAMGTSCLNAYTKLKQNTIDMAYAWRPRPPGMPQINRILLRFGVALGQKSPGWASVCLWVCKPVVLNWLVSLLTALGFSPGSCGRVRLDALIRWHPVVRHMLAGNIARRMGSVTTQTVRDSLLSNHHVSSPIHLVIKCKYVMWKMINNVYAEKLRFSVL